MPRETYTEAKNIIRKSKLFSSGKPFPITELAQEIGMSTEHTFQIMVQMVEDGVASRKRIKRTDCGGVMSHYRKINLKPRDYLCASYRRHSNEELGLEAEYCWAVL